MHVITKYKQQLGKLSSVFAASRPYDYHAALRNRRLGGHVTSKMPPMCEPDVLLSLFHDALMLRHLLHWLTRRLTERKAVAERGAPDSRLGAPCYREIGGGGPQNFMTLVLPCTMFNNDISQTVEVLTVILARSRSLLQRGVL